MRTAALLVTLASALAFPVARAEPLGASKILDWVVGFWRLPAAAWTDMYSRERSPMKIWLEEGRSIYKSDQVDEDRVHISNVGLPARKEGVEPNYLAINYTKFKQPGLLGKRVVWSLSMPTKDTFFWREFPLGRPVPALVRCARDEIG